MQTVALASIFRHMIQYIDIGNDRFSSHSYCTRALDGFQGCHIQPSDSQYLVREEMSEDKWI